MPNLEYGKQYLDHNGNITKPLVENRYENGKLSVFPFRDPSSGNCYTSTGRYKGYDIVSHYDLVLEYKPIPMKDSKAAEDLFPGKGETQDCKKIQESGGLDKSFNASGSKYLRKIVGAVSGYMDVYAVLSTFNVTCPAKQHAIKKLLCSGLREKGSTLQDLQEARDAIDRAIQLHKTE